MEKLLIKGVTKDVQHRPHLRRWAFPTSRASPSVYSRCWQSKKVNVDVILQSIGRDDTQGHQLHRGCHGRP